MTTCCWKFSKFCLNLNRTRLHKIRRRRARNNYIQVSTTKICHFFLRVEQETLHSSKNTTRFLMFVFQLQFMLKSQQKVDIKLSKICQSHQKLSQWQKAASRFTEIVVKTHGNVGVVSSYLSTSWILLINDTDVGACKQCLGLLTLLV